VLFDEIEKAHPDVFNILLQILADGNLTDSQGRRVDFKSAIVIMTTNLGAKMHGEVGRLGFNTGGSNGEQERRRERVEEELRRAFRPEFLNRVDEIIVFKPLGTDELKKIVSLMLASVTDRIENSGVLIEFDENVSDAVIAEAKDTEYGARPLRRAITKLVEVPYSDALLRGDFASGDFIRATFDGARIVFKKKSRRGQNK
jgi:ATP-dependent Clp protease ATP-binding subunit ClpC